MSSRRPGTRATLSVPPPETAAGGPRSAVTLGPRDRLVGQLYVEGDLRINGTVEGALEATGDIEVDQGGRVSGPVTAYNRLVVGSEGAVVGDVRVARLVVQDGATFNGKVAMGKPAAEAAAAAQPEPRAEAQIAPEPAGMAETQAPTEPEPIVVVAAPEPAVKPRGKRR